MGNVFILCVALLFAEKRVGIKLLYKIFIYKKSFIKKTKFMQSKICLIVAVFLLSAVAFVSCKKIDTNPVTSDETTQLSVQSDDQSRFSAKADAIANDANIVMESNASFNGKIENTLGTLCNATAVADSMNGTKNFGYLQWT